MKKINKGDIKYSHVIITINYRFYVYNMFECI